MMNSIQVHKRLYSVLPRGVAPTPSSGPRVRSNSASSSPSRSFYNSPQLPLSFFDSPPPPPPLPSRPTIGSSLRLIQSKPEAEPHSSQNTSQSQNQSAQTHNNGSGPPLYSVALSSPPSSQLHSPSNHIPQIFPYLPYSQPPSFLTPQAPEPQLSELQFETEHAQYQLDIGAYGIPKNSKPNSRRRDWLSPNSKLKNPSDEELNLAVQVGEDAYFITDNAMGVADGVGGWRNRSGVTTKPTQTPSALFASRLMHYCSDEVSNHTSTRWESPSHTHTSVDLGAPNEAEDADELYAELEDSLNDLEEGLDVLMILEHAYERAIKAHVTAVVNSEHQGKDPSSSLPHLSSPPINSQSMHRPLNAGSSTALLAILHQEHAHLSTSRHNRSSSRSGPSHSDRAPEETLPRVKRNDAVITIANLGDSMAMLVRGRDIVWRSEEMWWSFNTPVQLGPVSPSKPRDAKVFKLPVQADDILILASDGLSDNLWDEEILEEVVRVREVLLRHSHPWGSEDFLGNHRPGLHVLARKSLAGMLSEALCSRARRVAERGPSSVQAEVIGLDGDLRGDEVPFARRAREEGKKFKGGKVDDISVLVAVVSPIAPAHRPHP